MAPDKIVYDVLIIGGGPAGLSTALHLAEIVPHLIPRILLLEKAHYPRPKLCAGGMTIDAEIILERLGLDVREVPHVDASTAHFDFEGKGLKITAPKRHTLRIIRRDEFDAWLAEKAMSRGIEIREGITVKDVQPDDDGVTVVTDEGEFRAKVVVGADGSNGITRRCVVPDAKINTARVLEVITPLKNVIARPFAPRGRRPETGSKATRQSPRQEETAALPEPALSVGEGIARSDTFAYFDFIPVPENIPGYIWDFPTQIKGQPMRCWGIYDANLSVDKQRPLLKGLLGKEMERFGFNLDDYKLQGYPIRWFAPSNRFSVPRVLLVGDAAGADSLLGEGISIALGYGVLAAQEIEHALSTDDFSFSGYRRRLVRSALGRMLFARWFVAKIVYRLKWRWFQILLWRVLKPIVIVGSWIFILNWGKRLKL